MYACRPCTGSVQQYHFEPGMMYLYERGKCTTCLCRDIWIWNHHAVLATCRKYGSCDPNLWVQVLTYLAESYGSGSANVKEIRNISGGMMPVVAAAQEQCGFTGNNPQMCARYIQQVLQLGSAFLPLFSAFNSI